MVDVPVWVPSMFSWGLRYREGIMEMALMQSLVWMKVSPVGRQFTVFSQSSSLSLFLAVSKVLQV